jgi:hypothetical protein
MNFLSDVITYVRRLVKIYDNSQLSDALIVDYINRFYIMDIDARIQLFDLKKNYEFQTVPGQDRYNMPLYSVQTELGGQNIGMYPVYQGFEGPVFVNGIQVNFTTLQRQFQNLYPGWVQQNFALAQGDGTAGPYTLQIPQLSANTNTQNPPFTSLLRGHVDIQGIIATGDNVDPPVYSTLAEVTAALAQIPVTSISPSVTITTLNGQGNNLIVTDSGLFLSTNINYGLLINPGKAPYGHSALNGYSTTQNVVNYMTGTITVTFPEIVPSGQDINVQYLTFQPGLPLAVLYYNNTITLRSPPAYQYPVSLTGYLSPAAFLATSDAIPFAYMSEYIARGAARKILSDTGDVEQFQFYEPFFREQETLVWKRSQRQNTATRTPTIYSTPSPFSNYYGIGGY